MRSSATPARWAASYEQRMTAAPWSTSMLEHIRFAYGNTTMRLSGVTVRISSGEYAVRDHACGLPAATVGERRPQLADVLLVLLDAATGVGAERRLEQRIDQRRRDRAVRASRRRSSPAGRRRSPTRSGASSPVSHASSHAGLAARAPAGVHALGAADQHDVALARAGSRSAISSTSSCGLLPPTVVTAVAFGAMPSRRASERARIRVAPRHDLHDGDDVGAREQRRRPRRLRPRAPRPRAARSAARGLVGRLALRDLADADDDGARGSHGPSDPTWSGFAIVDEDRPRRARPVSRCRGRSTGTGSVRTRRPRRHRASRRGPTSARRRARSSSSTASSSSSSGPKARGLRRSPAAGTRSGGAAATAALRRGASTNACTFAAGTSQTRVCHSDPGLVVARVEQSVVDPDRVDARGRHEHRRAAAGGIGRARARARRPAAPAEGTARVTCHQLAHRVAVGAVSDEHVARRARSSWHEPVAWTRHNMSWTSRP